MSLTVLGSQLGPGAPGLYYFEIEGDLRAQVSPLPHKMTQGLKQNYSNILIFPTSDRRETPPISAEHNPSRDNPHQILT